MKNAFEKISEIEFEELLKGSQRFLFVYISNFLSDSSDVEDVLQRVNVVLWENANRFEPNTNFIAWARTVAHYQVLAFCKLQRHNRLFFSSELLEKAHHENAWDIDLEKSRWSALTACLETLRSEDRRLLELHYLADVSVQEIANQLQRPLKSIYRSLNRLRMVLLECARRRLQNEELSA